jgi:hypothetical protein
MFAPNRHPHIRFLPIPDPVEAKVYDGEYMRKYLGYARTEQGRVILRKRLHVLTQFVDPDETILDVGAGCGAFVYGARSYGYPYVYGSDINPWYPGPRPPEGWSPQVLTFFDSFEHIPAHVIPDTVSHIIMSIPVFRGNWRQVKKWVHYRPDEHCWYFRHRGLTEFMGALGFKHVWHEIDPEPGRRDINMYYFYRGTSRMKKKKT